MEEIGSRVVHIPVVGIRGIEHRCIDWKLKQCLGKTAKPTDVLTRETLELMTEKFTTPLQINHYPLYQTQVLIIHGRYAQINR